MTRAVARLVRLALVLPLALGGGCLYTTGRTVREVGPQISEQSVAAIVPGRTGVDWLTATFGEPASAVCLDDGTEIYRYDSDVRTTEGSYFLMVFASSSNRIERTSWWFEVRDGIILRCWGEQCVPITVTATRPPPEPRNPADVAEDAVRLAPPIEIDPATGDALPPKHSPAP
ncbi:MAG: hypothetical protein RLY21_1345 [Planctomycetota bacterium]|jgi:hypothetical protein